MFIEAGEVSSDSLWQEPVISVKKHNEFTACDIEAGIPAADNP